MRRLRALLALAAVVSLALAGLVLLQGGDADRARLISTFSTRFLGVFIEAAPFLIVGSLASGFIEVFVDRTGLARLTPQNPLSGGLMGTALGFVLPVCECGVVPVTRRLYAKGLPISVGVTFLLASPVMNPVVLISTWTAFGFGPILVGRYVITAVVAIAVGYIFTRVGNSTEVLRTVPQAEADIERVHAHEVGIGNESRAIGPRIQAAIALATDEFFDMGRYLIVGSLLAAGLQTLVSQEALVGLGRGPVASVGVMQALAYLLSVCSTVDAFLALAFSSTFTTGALLSFLTFGPMVDVKSTLMFLGVFRPRTVAYLVLLPLLMTSAIGVWINLNLAI